MIKSYYRIMLIFTMALSQFAFAVARDVPNDTARKSFKDVAAVVRMENGKAVCVMYNEGVEPDASSANLPICSPNSPRGRETSRAMVLAKSGQQTRTAFLSHLAALGVGCVLGTMASTAGNGGCEVAQGPFGRGCEIAGAGGTVVGAGLGYGLFSSLEGLAVIDFSGHGIASAAGAVLCGGGVTYYFYKTKLGFERRSETTNPEGGSQEAAR